MAERIRLAFRAAGGVIAGVFIVREGFLDAAVPQLLVAVDAALTGEISGYQPAWGEDHVSARPPTPAEARGFGIKRGSPVVVVHSRRFGADGSILEYSELIARADTRVEYQYDYLPLDAG